MENEKKKVLSWEEMKQRVDKKVEEAVDEVRRADFVGAGVKGTREVYESKLNEMEELIDTVGEISAGVDNGQSVYDEFVEKKKSAIDELELTEEKFLFPDGDKSDVRRVQLQALICANTCYETRGTLSDSIATLDNQLKNIKNDDAFYSAVVVNGSISAAAAEEALSNIDSELLEKQSAKKLAQRLHEEGKFDCKYELAKEIKRELSSINIESTIVCRKVKMVLENQKVVEEKKLRDMTNSYFLEFNSRIEESKKEYKHKLIWGTFAALIALLWIISLITEFNIVMTMLGNILPLVYVGCFYLTIAVINADIEERNKKRKKLRNQTVEYIEKEKKPQIIEEFHKKYNIFEMCRIIDDEVISKYYEKTCDLIKCCEELREKMFEFLSRLNKDITAITYLPRGINIGHMSKIIEFMESGAAEDYRSAAQQAVQYEVTNACNEAQIAIMKAMDMRQRNEARAQKEMQEYYERQRLAEARAAAARQEESARRAEQYAKEQLEAAKSAADAQKEAAKYAEKQVEVTEELLRRSDDPYYIKRFKNGE